MCQLYREAGCLVQRLREGIAARRSGRLLDCGVSVGVVDSVESGGRLGWVHTGL